MKEVTERHRLEHGATPLDPWSAKHPEYPDRTYYEVGMERIDAKVRAGIKAFTANFPDTNTADIASLGEFMRQTLHAAHANRVDYQHDVTAAVEHLKGEALPYAISGTATPVELVELFQQNPPRFAVDTNHVADRVGVEAFEYMKLTHPLDWTSDSVQAMRADIQKLYQRYELIDAPSRYRLLGCGLGNAALALVRKQPVAYVESSVGTIGQLIERQLLVAWNHGSIATGSDLTYLGRRIKNAKTSQASRDQLVELIEAELSRPADKRRPWLIAGSTSGYAAYGTTDRALNQESIAA